jgi:polysaccharide export outer membrane protein
LCASDVIAVTFPLTPEFDQTVSVQPDGFVSLAGAGDVHLEGLTTRESVEAIRAAYANVLKDPLVTVDLKDFNKPFFTVSGQVNHPGKYDLRGPTSVTQAIAVAGGFNEAARHSQVLLFRRQSDAWYEVKSLNVKNILRGHNLNEDTDLRPGDMLYGSSKHLFYRDVSHGLLRLYARDARAAFRESGFQGLARKIGRIRIRHIARAAHSLLA